MAYHTEGNRVVKTVRPMGKKKFDRITQRKTGMTRAELELRLSTDQQFAVNFYTISATVADPAFKRENPQHKRHTRRQYGLSHRQLNKDDKAYKRAIQGRDFQPSAPFDSIELDEGRACFGGRC